MSETRTALVTGANRGIGFEIARQLARQGLMVALGVRDTQKGKAAAEQLQAEGLELAVVSLDVDDLKSCRRAVGEVVAMLGRLDVMVNNACVFLERDGGGETSVLAVSPPTILRTFSTNVLGPLVLSQEAIPHMRSGGYGRIVNLSSGLGQLAEMGGNYAGYRMSKAALNALTRTLAAELADDPAIKVNSMCPGWVKTDMGGPNAARSVEEGADTAVWLATLDDDGPSGGFFRDRKPIAW